MKGGIGMGTIRRVRWHVLLALVALCLYPLSSADAQGDYIDDVHDQLQYDLGIYGDLGYSFVNFIIGKLDDDGVATWTFELSRRTDYIVTGACDEDCDDLDLRLKTATGTVADRDEGSGYWPEVSVTPIRDQDYTIEVDMYDCNVEPCYYGIALFEK